MIGVGFQSEQNRGVACRYLFSPEPASYRRGGLVRVSRTLWGNHRWAVLPTAAKKRTNVRPQVWERVAESRLPPVLVTLPSVSAVLYSA